MAKSLNFFGQCSGSTKSLMFQVRNGKLIVKDRVLRSKQRAELSIRHVT